MPPRKISLRQVEKLVEFAETHRDIAIGRFAGGPLGKQASREAWRTIAFQLNAIANGVNKTPEQWRRYWIEFKAKIKAKAADTRRLARGTGGGPSSILPLSELETRVLALIGPIAVEGLPGVKVRLNFTRIQTSAHLETRRLRIEEQHVAALNRIADTLERQTAALQQVADEVAQIKELMRVDI